MAWAACSSPVCSARHTAQVLQELNRPRRLVEGDVVRVVAPAGPIDSDRLQTGAHILESWGLQVEVGEHVLGRSRQGFMSGTDAERASDVERAWCDPRVAAVLCARGGYGSHRMLDRVDWSALRAARHADPAPVLVGFSDITALHEAVGVELGVATLLGPMVASHRFHDDPVSQEHLRATLFGETTEPISGEDVRTLVPGTATGVLAGGTVTLLAAGVGCRSARRSLRGAVLVLEDVDEPAYRIDRALTQLRRAGLLEGLAAVVGGTWSGCGPDDSVDQLLLDELGPLGVPMVNGVDVGHGLRHLTVPLGVPAVLDADAGTLTTAGPALR